MGAVAATLSALAVATPVRAFFETPGATGRVLAAFDQSAYIETEEGQLVALLAESLGRGAFALTVGGSPSFASLRPGHPTTIEEHSLRLGDIRIDLTSAAPWDPTLPALVSEAEEGMAILDLHLRAYAPAEGLAAALFAQPDLPDEALVAQGRSALERIRAALGRADAAALTGAVADLAGLGPGLTPSGDDVLAGLLLALRLWPQAAGRLGPRIVATLILGTAAPRTGRISRAYLWAARQSLASGAWHDLIHALPGAAEAVTTAVTRILQTGETSGADMLAGFLFGWRLSARAG